ncbi:hypothetical protein [Streptomyces sp. NPDC001070]
MAAEVLLARHRPGLVVGCSSTALVTSAALHGIPAARVGTGLLLDRIAPYENGDRIPLTLVDAALPDLERDAAVVGRPSALGGEAAAARLAPLAADRGVPHADPSPPRAAPGGRGLAPPPSAAPPAVLQAAPAHQPAPARRQSGPCRGPPPPPGVTPHCAHRTDRARVRAVRA